MKYLFILNIIIIYDCCTLRTCTVHIVSMSLQLLQKICYTSLNIKYLYVVINFIKIFSNYFR